MINGLKIATEYCVVVKHNLMRLAFCVKIITFSLNFCYPCLTLNSFHKLLFKVCEFRLVIIVSFIHCRCWRGNDELTVELLLKCKGKSRLEMLYLIGPSTRV